MLSRALLKGVELHSPCGHRGTVQLLVNAMCLASFETAPLQRARGDCRRVTDTQAAHFPRLLLIVLLCQCAKLLRVLLLDGASFAVELLYFVEPGDASRDLSLESAKRHMVAAVMDVASEVQCCMTEFRKSVLETYPSVDRLEAIL